MRWRFVALLAGCGFASSALAEDAMTVQSLLAGGYSVVSSMSSQIGPGLFLQKGDSLYLCFVTEKPDAPEITTAYCKPIH